MEIEKLNQRLHKEQHDMNECKECAVNQKKVQTLDRMIDNVYNGYIEWNTCKYLEWSSDTLVDWICMIEKAKYKQYEDNLRIKFKEKQINGQSLKDIKQSDLEACGVDDVIHANSLLNEIKNLIKPITVELEENQQ